MARRPKARLHVVFNQSGAGSLKIALRCLQSDERVVALVDDFSLGPIDPPSLRLRNRFLDERGLLFGPREGRNDAIRKFWSRALSSRVHPVVWFSRQSAEDFAGVHELVWRLGDAPIDLIDVTDLGRSFGFIPSEQMVKRRLVERAVPLEKVARAAYRRRWKRLRRDNTALRVVEDGVLVSAPITYFDELLMSFVGNDWVGGGRVIGSALAEVSFDDPFLWSRVVALVDDGVLEGQLMATMGTSRVRRAQ